MGWTDEELGFISQEDQRFLFSPHHKDWLRHTQPPVGGYWGSFPRKTKDFSFLHIIKTGSDTPSFLSVGTGVSFPSASVTRV
jgi:hypothetical protein